MAPSRVRATPACPPRSRRCRARGPARAPRGRARPRPPPPGSRRRHEPAQAGDRGVIQPIDKGGTGHRERSDVHTWSRDGKWLYYTTKVGEAVELLRASPGGKIEQL